MTELAISELAQRIVDTMIRERMFPFAYSTSAKRIILDELQASLTTKSIKVNWAPPFMRTTSGLLE